MRRNQSGLPRSRHQSVLHHQVRKKQKQEEAGGRFSPCPVCHRSFPSYFISDHVNICLDGPAQSSLSTDSPLPPCNSQRLHLDGEEEGYGQLRSSGADASAKGVNVGDGPCPDPPLLACPNSTTAVSSHGVDRETSHVVDHSSSHQRVEERDEVFRFSRSAQENCVVAASDSVESAKASDEVFPPELPQVEGMEREAQDTMASHGEESVSDKPGRGLQIFQVQRQSQAKLAMLCKFSMSAALERKPTVSVLQPGMVLLRSWLSMDIQQRLVNESQSAAHLFKRPTTAGGGKYHLWQMAFGCHWDSKSRRYAAQSQSQRFPAWMYDLGKDLASNASDHTHVYSSSSNFTPDVALVNFYPVKDEELGVVGLGGHQDLDDYCDMPVVSVSVGDSMTFFYRRVPPQSRRKSGIQIVVDQSAAKSCKDGDTAHNSEKKIILESGDVLVFGGESRLVYHGTRSVQPGTRPPGLHMAPGRLNFTFRQCNAPRS